MAVATVTNLSGTVPSADAFIIVPRCDRETKRIIKLLTLYNPNGSAAAFLLRQVVLDAAEDEMTIRRFDDSIPATDAWIFGSLGAIWVVEPTTRVELVLDADPDDPIEYSVDIARAV